MAGDMTGSISNWAGGGASTTLGAVQLAYGMYQQKKNKRPTYEIPQEIQQNLTQAQNMALQGLPEEQKQQYLSNLQRGSAQALASSSSRGGGLAGIANINQQQNDAYGNLLSMDSQARNQNQQLLMGQRQTMADYKDQAFQINKVNPYYEKTSQNNAMMGAGMQNMSQGFQAGNTGGSGGYENTGGKSQQQVTPQSGNQYYSPNGNDATGMYNFNPNSTNGQGNYNYEGNQYGTNV